MRPSARGGKLHLGRKITRPTSSEQKICRVLDDTGL